MNDNGRRLRADRPEAREAPELLPQRAVTII